MGDVVNLRRTRKTVVRKKAAVIACENAVKFGRSKARKLQDAAALAKARRDLDGKLRE